MILTVVIIYLSLMILYGVFLSKRIKRASDFLVAGRKPGFLLTTTTLAAATGGYAARHAAKYARKASSKFLHFKRSDYPKMDPEEWLTKNLLYYLIVTYVMWCNLCLEACQIDLMIPHPEKFLPPIVLYGGECWYCGCCVDVCPREGAIKLISRLKDKVHFQKKD